MSIDVLLVYAVVSFFYIISPGPAIFLAMSNGMSANMRVVAISSLGNITGLLLLSTLSILGLGAILAASSTLFLMTKLLGAGYLIYLGVKQFRHARNMAATEVAPIDGEVRRHRSYYTEGFLLAATNPKAILFFTAFYPQFLDMQAAMAPQFFIMTGLFMLLSFMSLFSYGYISKSARQWLTNQARMTWFHRITGGLFVGMGVGLLQLRNQLSY